MKRFAATDALANAWRVYGRAPAAISLIAIYRPNAPGAAFPIAPGSRAAAARSLRAAMSADPCPDCGQGWPDGCAFDCPSRDE